VSQEFDRQVLHCLGVNDVIKVKSQECLIHERTGIH
jgi:hypothetical protein